MSLITPIPPVPHPAQPRFASQVRTEENRFSAQYAVGAAGLAALASVRGHCQQKQRCMFRNQLRPPSTVVRLALTVSERHGSAVQDRRRNTPVYFEELGRPVADGNKLGVMLYLPDLDFGGKLASSQYESLAARFELWCCALPAGEQHTGLAQLEESVVAWLEAQLERDEQVVLLGNSFGSLLALKLAFRFGRRLKGLVLVNPSTYYTGAAMQNLFRSAPAAVAAASATLERLLLPASDDGEAEGVTASGELLMGAAVKAFGLRSVASASRNKVLAFRLRAWLRIAWEQVDCELRRPPKSSPLPPTLLAFSGSDPLRSIKNEALTLKPLLEKRCGPERLQLKELEGVGLEPLSNGGLDFAAIICDSPVCKPPRDVVKDFSFPSLSEVEEGSANVEQLASVLSPVFCSASKGDASKREFGLSGVPTPADLDGRPVLLVGNHQLYGVDLGPIVREFLLDRGVIARGLAFPGAMRRGRRRDGAGDEGIGGTFQTFGAVPVSARNIFKLLQQGEMVLLFPGGVREALHGPDEQYQLQWPQKTDFVRVAARFNAVVVPFAGVGVDDNLKVLTTSQSIREQSRQILQNLLPFPLPEPGDDKEASIEEGLMPVSESLAQRPSFPILAPPGRLASATEPGIGDRLYFSFGEPFDLQGLDPKNRGACSETYDQIREAVRRELAWLLAARQQDPYRDVLRRQVWERAASLEPSSPRRIPAGPLEGKLVKSYGR
eukprot:TRINITY_DN24447_c0_g2_i1.p1 TRINITY_DN24447_c0_g2~~TRINITY_DN24447_c0_g2_i1.p1  ORF type:complete len:723 (-),score=123.82 TRINITY_DN24447_c0_g2_i1:31-2199(-)